MIKSLLFTSCLSFSSSVALLNKAPFHEPNKQNEETQIEYYTDYIDLAFFDMVTFETLTIANNNARFFRIKGGVSKEKLLTTGVFENDFKYFNSGFYIPNTAVTLATNIENIDLEFIISFSNGRLTDKVDQYGFALVTDYYNGDEYDYSIIPNSWLNFELIDSIDNDEFEITIIIPYGNNTHPPRYWETYIQNNLRFFNQKYYDKFIIGLANVDYEKGFIDGYVDGNNDGLQTGYDNGYNIGFNDGVASDFNAYSWLTGIFSALGGLLSIQLLPNVSIGGILILIMVLTLLPFLIGLLKGGKG